MSNYKKRAREKLPGSGNKNEKKKKGKKIFRSPPLSRKDKKKKKGVRGCNIFLQPVH